MYKKKNKNIKQKTEKQNKTKQKKPQTLSRYRCSRRVSHLELGRGDNLQLFISPLLKYGEWLYNIIGDKNFEINLGVPKIPHTPYRDL